MTDEWPIPTPEQAGKLKEWTAEAKQWISPEAAVEVIRARLNTTLGHAQKLLRDARASGEVRYANDDGVVQDSRFDYAYSRDDLEGWLDRHPSRVGKTPPAAGKPRVSAKRKSAEAAIAALWPKGPPDAVLNDTLVGQVIEWLKADCKKQKIAFAEVGRSTILRAARRMK